MKKSIKSLISLALIVMILLPSISTAATELINEVYEPIVEVNDDKSEVIEGENETEGNITEEKGENNITEEEVEESSDEILNALENEQEKLEENESTIEMDNYMLDVESIVGEKYEIVNKEESKNSIQSYSVELFEREEFNLKYPTIVNSTKLRKKTEAEYEIALAYSDGSYTYLDSVEDFEEAKSIVENTPMPISEDMILPTIIDSEGKVVYSTRTMGRIWKHIDGEPYSKFDKNTNIYSDSSLTNAYTYINQGYIDDVPVIEYNDKSAKIQVNGYNGWINKDTDSGNYDLVLVPINQVTNPSYYSVSNGILYHFISSNITDKENRGSTLRLGPAPEYLKEGIKYLSYDGRYFYNGSNIALGLDSLIGDLQSGHNNNAVNANKAYYNYYNYLPFRSKTAYTVGDLNKFIEANTKTTSKLRGTGQAFIDAQNTYGVNALLALGVGINESAWGESTISQSKNNIFGLNAVDSNPGEAANSFKTVGDSIIEFAKNYISRGYADPADWRYFGGFLGNKNMGTNIKYASDPFWGEKASAHAFSADYYLSGENLGNLKDFNAFQIIMYTNANEVRDASNNLLYKINSSVSGHGGYPGTTAIVTSKEEKLINGVYSLEIYPERNTPINNGGNDNKYHGNYDWNSKAYIQSKNIVFINASNTEVLPVDPSYANKWKEVGGKVYYYDNNGVLCKGWRGINGYWYFFDKKTGERKSGWLADEGRWYFLHNDGKMATGLTDAEGTMYYFDDKGYMKYGWYNLSGEWYYFGSSGAAATGWLNLNGTWYYLNSDGKMATGLKEINSKLYLLGSSGAMLKGWQKVGTDWYYFLSSGEARKGWLDLNGTWYYLNSDGKMATGLKEINSKLYLLGSSGAMLKGWQKVEADWYYFLSSGEARKGWLDLNGTWYYLNSDGKMATGLKEINSKLYLLGSSGAMLKGWQKVEADWYYFLSSGEARKGWLDLSGTWYYLKDDGKMATGWIEVDGKKYYLKQDGSMAKNTTIDGIYVDGSGVAR